MFRPDNAIVHLINRSRLAFTRDRLIRSEGEQVLSGKSSITSKRNDNFRWIGLYIYIYERCKRCIYIFVNLEERWSDTVAPTYLLEVLNNWSLFFSCDERIPQKLENSLFFYQDPNLSLRGAYYSSFKLQFSGVKKNEEKKKEGRNVEPSKGWSPFAVDANFCRRWRPR